MELIKQQSFETCGQACIAMITGKDINDVIRDMRTSGSTSIGQLIEILDKYEIRHAPINRAMLSGTFEYQRKILSLISILF